jgi:hypothetical protein
MADESTPPQTPPMPVGAGIGVKIPAVKPTPTGLVLETDRELRADSPTPCQTPPSPVPGFTGIRLSVAYCSFVI